MLPALLHFTTRTEITDSTKRLQTASLCYKILIRGLARMGSSCSTLKHNQIMNGVRSPFWQAGALWSLQSTSAVLQQGWWLLPLPLRGWLPGTSVWVSVIAPEGKLKSLQQNSSPSTQLGANYTTSPPHRVVLKRRELVPSLAGPWGTNHAVAGTSQPGAAPSLGFSSHLAYSSFYCSTLKLDSYFRAAAILANLYNCIKYK